MQKLATGILLIVALTGCASTSNSEKATDTESNKQVNIFDIEDASFYDDSETFKYYWGVNFSTDQPTSTKLNCSISALNSEGEEILGVQQVRNVVNNGVTVAYGEGDLPTTTKEKYKAIDSFSVSCTQAINQ